MKKLFILAMAFLSMACTNQVDELIEEVEEKEVVISEEYRTMYTFIEDIYYSELFGIELPVNPNYDEMMQIAAPIIMTDTFADTLGECECEQVYRLMFAYFQEHDPHAKVTSYLEYLLVNGLY
jgi:chloramphenicol O-acetyltransferase